MQENLGGHFQSRDQITLSWSPCVFLCVPICSFRTLWPIHLIGERRRENKCSMKIYCWEGLKNNSSVLRRRLQYECLFIGIYQRGRSCTTYLAKALLGACVFFKYQVQQSRGEKRTKLLSSGSQRSVFHFWSPWLSEKAVVFFFSHYDEHFTRKM